MKCPKCNIDIKELIYRQIGKNYVYDCINCKDQIAKESLIK